ncbi:hypothetical protein G8S55_01195 [Clostridium botulinum C]|uniref:hypothetical protein n=1 Tax=Clostridium botulinum TaxID=1491 RepID=UPI001E554243|nr:hypothetical protein [Clostridium botulinum]MCD3215865.1 hypothetical protein [Clostridium botulinum C]
MGKIAFTNIIVHKLDNKQNKLELSSYELSDYSKIEAHSAPCVSQYEIIGMADQDMYNTGDYYMFQGNQVETDGTLYVKVRQIGYGHRYI